MSRYAFFAALALVVLCVPSFSQTRQERLAEHVYFFASDSLNGRAAGSKDAAKAAAYIVHEFESMGLKPFYEDWYMPFTTNNRDFMNVVAVLEGNDPELKDQYIVIGAHYDHLGVKNGKVYNGADDNASGTAAVIEMARILCSNRDKLKRTVVFAAFDAEELGLYGSTALASRMLEQDSLDVRLMMSVDMVGWYKASNSLTLAGVSTIKNGRKVLQTEKLNLKLRNFEWSPVTATDTEGFAREQVPTLAVSTGLVSPYHKPEDDADLIDYEGLDKVTDYLADLTFEVATDENFASSGKVARKHRDGVPILEAGLYVGAGNTYFRFPQASFNGKGGFTYGGGMTAQLNFGHHSHFGLKADVLYEQAKALYPDEKDFYASALQYKGSELRVPVQFLVQGGERGAVYLGVGGFYAHRFKTSLPVSQTIRQKDYGLAAEFGIKVGSISLSTLWMSSLTPFFEEGAPSVRQGTSLFKLCKFF